MFPKAFSFFVHCSKNLKLWLVKTNTFSLNYIHKPTLGRIDLPPTSCLFGFPLPFLDSLRVKVRVRAAVDNVCTVIPGFVHLEATEPGSIACSINTNTSLVLQGFGPGQLS